MKDIEIGIIGGTSGMGRFFARLLKEEGYTTFVSGRKIGMDPSTMAQKCRVIIVSVPISITCEVIEQVGPYMKKESLLMDLTSLKGESIKSMLKSSVSEVIGLHPLFGPGVDSIAGYTIVLCPVRTEKWLQWLKDILVKNGANIMETTPERHDELMGLVQGLNHLNSITMGMVLRKSGENLTELRRFATPMFNTKLALVEKTFTKNPRLFAEIVNLNPNINKVVDLYCKTLFDLKNVINRRNVEAFLKVMRENNVWDS
jgi:prephenate dehydrogenase